jgi:drug/metabolite transporter (DMT)-like permease
LKYPTFFRDGQRSAELLVVASVIFASTGQIVMKAGVGHGASAFTKNVWPLHAPFTVGVLGGLFVYGIGTMLWIKAVSKERISYLYPLASLNYILVALGGWLFLREPQPLARWVGLFIMSFGIALLTRAANRTSEI